MKIVHVIDSGGLYGKERMLIALIKKQVENGHDVFLIGFGKWDFYEEIIRLQLAIHIVHIHSALSLFSMLNKNEYEIIHTHDYKSGILVALWHHFHSEANVIRTLHGYTSMGKPWYSRIRAYEAFDKYLLPTNTFNVGVSDDLANDLNTEMIPNGIEKCHVSDINIADLKQNIIQFCTEDDKAFVFCCMARLSAEKNLMALIEAIKILDNTKLLLFGDGPLRDDLIRAISLYPNKVFFAGFDKNAKYYLQFVDGYIQPSLTEGMPISILEALSLSVPIIASHVGGMKILHELYAAKECYLTPVNMAYDIQEFMSMGDNEKYQQILNGINLFNRKFSAEAMYREYDKLYLAVMSVKES